jgi:AcrR family transcriptional regulator
MRPFEEPASLARHNDSRPPAEPAQTRMTRQERREQFLNVAARLIQRGGLGAVTMERVAEYSGISKRILYRHFANSDQLLAELFRREVVQSRAQIRDAIATNPGLASRAGLRTFFQSLTKGDQVLPELLALRSSVSGPLEEAKEAFLVEGEQYFSATYRDHLGLSETTARIAATIVMAAMNGAIRSWDKAYGSPEEIEPVVAALIDGGLKNLADLGDRRTATKSTRRSKVIR